MIDRRIVDVLQSAVVQLLRAPGQTEMLGALLDCVARLVPYDSATVMLVDDDGVFRIHAARGYERFTDERSVRAIAIDQARNPLLRTIVTERAGLLVPDAHADPRWERVRGAEHVLSWIGVPLVIEGRVIGVYSVDKAEARFFTEEHLRLVEHLAPYAAVAIEEARVIERLEGEIAERRKAERRALGHGLVLQQIARREPLAHILASLTLLVEEEARGALCSILLADGEGRLRHGAAPSLPRSYVEAIDGIPIGPGAGSCGAAAFRGEPVVVEDISVDPRWDDYREAGLAAGLAACWSTPIADSEGRVVGTFAVYHTRPALPDDEQLSLIETATQLAGIAIEQDATQRALRESESRLSQILDALPVGVLVIDPAGAPTFVNAAGVEMLGPVTAPGAAVEQSLPLLDVRRAGSGEPYPAHELPLARALAGEKSRADDLELEGPDGIVPLEMLAAPVYDASGRIAFACAAFSDIRERLEVEQRLAQSQKLDALGQLAGGIAHDFNNILTAVGGYAALVLSTYAPGDPRAADVGEIVRASERAAALTQQLLTFSRRQVIRPAPIDVAQAVTELENMLRRLIGGDIELRIRTDSGPALVCADASQLSQVIVNLVLNARDAMPGGGVLTIDVSGAALGEPQAGTETGAAAGNRGEPAPRRYVSLAVSDTGVGMDAETMQHLFEPFFTTKPAGSGTGLGLATVHGIVKQGGGCVAVRSEPGEGATFTVYLPALADAGAAADIPTAGGA
ncbi:Histidine kinase-, DNA gyrase B-, and HSP90-like ATPase [Gaiella occulta]|uniref:histidine kinase n=1 Tax=Gaiella occulta TaxID=1002870 RepID=A0A7M2YUY2_9ACTN|nr:GAF domain-containing protein [Gaiella occulta]RDI73923.1 Histidine kinase-, DNA gyrase B-, and HSP90-like ATPase [Gaiella occulta]